MKITIEGVKEIRDRLNYLAKVARNPVSQATGYLARLELLIRRGILSNWKNQSSPSKGKWAEYKNSYYAKWKKKKGWSKDKLILSGKLRMTAITAGTARIEGDSLVIPMDLTPPVGNYAGVHQFGGGKGIPARPYFEVGNDVIAQCTKLLEQAIKESTK